MIFILDKKGFLCYYISMIRRRALIVQKKREKNITKKEINYEKSTFTINHRNTSRVLIFMLISPE